MTRKNETTTLDDDLKKFNEQGIRADRKHLLEDIGSQFSNHLECFREYVVNASDARATWCRVSGSEDEETITIHVHDNGHGMDRQRVIDFMTLFRSIKEGDPKKAVGRFGVGKASILAIPDLIGFGMETSTGKEAWRMRIDSFLDEKPVHVKCVSPAPEQGTIFSITFVKKKDLSRELQEIGDILYTYVRFLPLTITVQDLSGSDEDFSRFRHINARWSHHQERLGRRFTFSLNNSSFEVIIGMGANGHEIYQNQVLVTTRYNLFFHDLKMHHNIPNISLRVDSPDFELPFGRHGLRNEEILNPLSRYLRDTILPIYFDELRDIQCQDRLVDPDLAPLIRIDEIEELACSLLNYDAAPNRSWANTPLFATWGHPRVSFRELHDQVDEAGRVYLDDSENIGADYAAFDGPVLSGNQPVGGMSLLQKVFAKQLINLGVKDMVLEQPDNGSRHLGKAERRFESFLGFRPELVDQFNANEVRHSRKPTEDSSAPGNFFELVKQLHKTSGLSREAQQARTDLEDISWRVNYLVERDGATPCISQKFLYKDNCVVLNLHHPEVEKLLSLSRELPALAGHWALALCMEDDKKILSHLTPEGREDLIRLDALVRSYVSPEKLKKQKPPTANSGMGEKFHDYLRTVAACAGIPKTVH